MRSRYLSMDPVAALARAGDAGAVALLVQEIGRDIDWPVRARAAELSAEFLRAQPALQSALVQAASDAEPRVREAALSALASAPPPAAVGPARILVGRDGWSFVRRQAVSLLANAPASKDVDESLGDAVEDGSPDVRAAVLTALGQRRVTAFREALRARLDDKSEDSEVRAAAAKALGSVCDARSVDPLTEWARALGGRETSDEDRRIAVGALEGLATLHPKDLKARLAPLLAASAPPEARQSAERAVGATGACTWRP
jgi:HEAT repeat protein